FSTYLANVEMPGNERFYSFDFNQIHFIIINTEEYWTHPDDYEYEITTEQYNWIINDLENNSKSFTIAMYHRPSYSVRSSSRNYQAGVIREVLEPILIEYEVDLVFSGHDHYYYKTTRNDIVHVVTGGSGAPLYTPTATEYAIAGDKYFAEYHYCNVSVAEDKLTITVLKYDGTLENTSVEDVIELSLLETPTQTETTTETSFLSGFLIFTFIVSISIRRKGKNKNMFKM
ncbi:MAG: metallophosphoesterase family protein, partial [Candidatus Heimdallarchaeaceae archaeon]